MPSAKLAPAMSTHLFALPLKLSTTAPPAGGVVVVVVGGWDVVVGEVPPAAHHVSALARVARRETRTVERSIMVV